MCEDAEKVIYSIENKKGHKPANSIAAMKHIELVISPLLSHLIDTSLMNGSFPHFPKLIRVSPIIIASESPDVNNYRPISSLPILSKIVEKKCIQSTLQLFRPNHLIYSPTT